VGFQGVPGTLSTIDAQTLSQVGPSLPAINPTGLTFDPATSTVFAVESTADTVTSFKVDPTGLLTRGTSANADPGRSPTDQPVGVLVLGTTRQLLVPLTGQGRASLFAINPNGSLTFVRSINGVIGGTVMVDDPSTGRTYVVEPSAGQVAALVLETPVAAPSIAFVLPGPLDISLAPADVARSVGITAFVMLLLGAPTPIFNSTLDGNRALIERWIRRKRPRRLGQAGSLSRFGRQLLAWSHTWIGLVLYLFLAALLYAFLDNTFPFQNAARTFGTTLFGIAVGTAVSQVPGELYVRKRFKTRGKVHVALWTLILAGACVLITRLTGVQPGYVYGIIGGFVFAVTLTAEDRGRMAFRGMTVLLAAGIAAWFLRIPFEPGRGPVGGEAAGFVGKVLAGVFITAIEAAAIGLIPLHFLEGEPLYAWSRRRWAVLWVISLVLFTHVLLYPVSDVVPSPSPTGVWTVVLAATAYALIALGFWWFFSSRERRRRRRRSGVAALA